MTIESITICNITSLEGEHFIDFTAEPLRSAGLFAITGDTGAGKSSLLDAICLALYGKTPRLDEKFDRLTESQTELAAGTNAQLSLNDPRAYLRRGAKQGYARVRFSVPSGGTYEASWEVGLTRNETFKSVERSLDEISSKGKVTRVASGKTDTQAAVERVIGLDYEQFSRTVILAQGSFASFLKAQSKEKSVLLEKLTGTAIYGRISTQIFDMCKEAEQEVLNERAKYEGLAQGRLSEEDVVELQHRGQMLASVLLDLQHRKERTTQFLQWHAKNVELMAQYDEAMKRNTAANNEYLLMRDKEKALSRYDAVLPFRPAYERINELSNQIELIKEKESEIAQEIAQLQAQMKTADQELQQATERKSAAEEQMRLRSGDISRGHTLQGEIISLEKQQSEAETAKEQAVLTQEKTELDLRTRLQDEERLKKELEQLNLRRQSLEIHRTMFDNYQTITEKLKQYAEEMRYNDRLDREHRQENHLLQELTEQFEKVKATVITQEGALSSLRANRLGHQQSIAHISETELYDSYNRDTERRVLLEEARRMWQEITERYERMSELRAQQQRWKRQIEQKEAEILLAEKEEQSRFKRFDQLKEAFMLAQVKDVELLRTLLKEGTPCPVCGSAHHPYHTEVEQVSGERQQQLEKDFREAERYYKAQREMLTLLQEEKRNKQAQQNSEAQVLKALEEKQQNDVAYWAKFAHLDPSFVECSPEVNRQARRTTIEMLIDAVERQKKQSEKDLEVYRFHSTALKEVNEKVAKLEETLEVVMKQRGDLETNLRIHAQNRERIHQLMVQSDARIEGLYKSLDDLLTLAGWRDDSIEAYMKRLSEIYEEWRLINDRIDAGSTEQRVLRNLIETLQQTVKDQYNATNALRGKCSQLRELLAERREEIVRLFGHDTPKSLAETLQRNIDVAAAQFKQLQGAHESLNAQLQQTVGQQQSLAENRVKSEGDLRQRRTDLDMAITRFNRDNEPLQQTELNRIFQDPRDWQALRIEISTSKERMLLAQQTMQQASDAYNAWQGQPNRPSDAEDEQPEALQEALPLLEEKLLQQQSEQEELKHRLRRHEDSIRESESQRAMVERAEENATEWKRLSAVFGSKDGKKFRDMAQSYTFSLLVEHANFHLRRLTPRYGLKVIPGSLTLEVVDHDMLDEHRYVNSLSGGETFIVSLALALGLASLSSTTLNIGSLFIDEGFGHLDENSLAMVLDALAALEDGQGRKVGVVSHTEQIRAQIAPQVKIVKQGAGGCSTIVVE